MIYSECMKRKNRLFSIASKDVATNDIRDDLLTCESRGKTLLNEFAEKRLKEQNVEFYAPIQKVHSPKHLHISIRRQSVKSRK